VLLPKNCGQWFEADFALDARDAGLGHQTLATNSRRRTRLKAAKDPGSAVLPPPSGLTARPSLPQVARGVEA
jgi:hypothetical protein